MTPAALSRLSALIVMDDRLTISDAERGEFYVLASERVREIHTLIQSQVYTRLDTMLERDDLAHRLAQLT